MTAEILASKPWEYVLYRTAHGHVLTVACGGTAMYELHIPLTAAEETSVLGNPAGLEALAAAVRADPHAWTARSGPDPA